jgi:hypothetical protein
MGFVMRKLLITLSGIIMLCFFSSFGDNYEINWPDINLVNKEHKILLITLGGVGAISSNDVDAIKDLGNDFAEYRNDIVIVTGKPHMRLSNPNIVYVAKTYTICNFVSRNALNFLFPGAGTLGCVTKVAMDVHQEDVKLDYNDLLPSGSDIASRINNYVSRMAPDTKIIMVGKSMGGCMLYHAHQSLNATYKRPVELLILVDASCNFARHHVEAPINIERNVKKALAFHQSKSGEIQTGYQINFLNNPALNKSININVGDDAGVYGKICDNVGHDNIDNCDTLLRIVRDRIKKAMSPEYDKSVLYSNTYQVKGRQLTISNCNDIIFPPIPGDYYSINNYTGNIKVEWGDGTENTYSFDVSKKCRKIDVCTWKIFSHTYPKAGKYKLVVKYEWLAYQSVQYANSSICEWKLQGVNDIIIRPDISPILNLLLD